MGGLKIGLRYRKRIKLGKYININISKSSISPSIRMGRITHNLKNKTTTVRLGNGLSYVFNKKKNRK